jgi:hypothetical protein
MIPNQKGINNKADRGKKNDDDNKAKVGREGWSEGVMDGRGGRNGWWQGGSSEQVILGFHRRLERVVNEVHERLAERVVGGTGRQKP